MSLKRFWDGNVFFEDKILGIFQPHISKIKHPTIHILKCFLREREGGKERENERERQEIASSKTFVEKNKFVKELSFFSTLKAEYSNNSISRHSNPGQISTRLLGCLRFE